MRGFFLVALFIASSFTMLAQLSINATGSNFTIDFDNTIADVNNSAFQGSGLQQTPTAGQLDSDAWEIRGASDGTLLFGGTGTTGDFARGASAGGVTSGGLYAFDLGGSGQGLGIQPTGSDFTQGSITLRVENNLSGQNITSLDLAYDIYEFNDQGRSNSLNFSYSIDNSTYIDIPALDFATMGTASGAPTWQTTPRNTTIGGLNIPENGFIYLRWTSDDETGSGSRDEIAIDDIVMNASAGTPVPNITVPATVSVNENVGTTDLIISIDSAPASDVVVDISFTDQSATVTNDYTIPAITQVTFTAGSSASQTVSIPIVDDGILEPTEDFDVEISINSGMANITNSLQNITIIDDDLACSVSAGDLIFTEIMYNPAAVNDNLGEWVEIYNSTSLDIDLLGYTLSDNADSHTINSSVIVPAGGYVVLGRSTDQLVNGGVAVDYQFESLFLSNSGDEVTISCEATVVDQVVYDTTIFPDAGSGAMGMPGNSISLDLVAYDAVLNDDGTNWCFVTATYGDGDTGTPGAENPLCTPIYDDQNAVCEDDLDGITVVTSTGGGTWQDIFSADGRIIASVNDEGAVLGAVTTSVYITGAAREDDDGTNYMGRSVYINVQTQPTGGIEPMVRLYFTDAELQQLIADAGTDPDAPIDEFGLVITKVDNVNCSPSYVGVLADISLITPVANEYGNDFFLEFPVSNFSGFYIHGGATILPTELNNFEVELVNHQSHLQWSTASEANNDYFNVQHSTTGAVYETIGQVAGNGTTQWTSFYSYVHDEVNLGTNYYRLQQVDKNGNEAYSDVIKVVRHGELDIYYLPSQSLIVNTNPTSLVEVFDVTGRIVAVSTDGTAISTQDWPSGIYIVRQNTKAEKITVF